MGILLGPNPLLKGFLGALTVKQLGHHPKGFPTIFPMDFGE